MLLTTKFFVPQQRTNLVHRRRLIDTLNTGLNKKLILVSAPAGFGKTTLITEWLSGLKERGIKACWLSLDENDNDPQRFLAYLLGALQRVDPQIGAAVQSSLQTPQLPPLEVLLTTIVNDLTLTPTPFVLVLDDYHLINTPSIHQAVTFLVENMPATLHLAMTSRSDPPLPLSRWRVRREIVEVRARDLRFTQAEVAAFLQQEVGIPLSTDDIAALEERTEGWVAGLQLAALSLQERPDAAEFIKSFTGSHAYIVDYLSEEVLQRQPAAIQEFLLVTAILERMCGALVDTLLGGANGQETLVQLDRAHLFVIPLDNERTWYRYHHLFAGVLRSRLKLTQPERLPSLHRAASHWFAEQGLIGEAVQHALQAQEFMQAAHLIEENAAILFKRGEHSALAHWVDGLPETIRRSRPRLGLARAAVHIAMNNLEPVEQSLHEVEAAVQSLEDGAERKQLLSEVAARRTAVAIYRGDGPRAADYAQQALADLPPENLLVRGQVMFHLGVTLAWAGKLQEAYTTQREAYKLSNAAGDFNNALLALFNQASLLRDSGGDFAQAVQQYTEALHWANEHKVADTPNAGLIHIELSRIYYDWNDLERAYQHGHKVTEIGQRTGAPRVIVYNAECYAQTLYARGEHEAAQAVLQQAQQLLTKHNLSSRYSSWLTLAQVRFWLALGLQQAADQWAAISKLSIEDEFSILQVAEYLALARVLTVQGQAANTLPLLNRAGQLARDQQRIGLLIRVLAQTAVTECLAGDPHGAHHTLQHALTLAAPNRLIRSFIDEGEPMRALLDQMRTATRDASQAAYVDKLLATFGAPVLHQPPATPFVAPTPHTPPQSQPAPIKPVVVAHTPPQPLIEPLSERELEVLRLVAQGLSDRQLAEQLIVAIGTVKKHLNNIYGKLGVNSRTQALARARELALL